MEFPTNTLIAAQTWLPAVSVPAGFTDTNLPVGLEMVGLPYREADLLSLAYAFEQATLHRKPSAPRSRAVSRGAARTEDTPWLPTIRAWIRPSPVHVKGQLDQALLLYLEALGRNPRDRTAAELVSAILRTHFELAVSLTKLGRASAAIESFQRVLAIQPDEALAHASLSRLFLARDDRDQAITHLRPLPASGARGSYRSTAAAGLYGRRAPS